MRTSCLPKTGNKAWTHIHCFQVAADNLATWETVRVIHLKYISTGARPNEVFFNFKKICNEGPGHLKTVNYKMTMPVLFEAINGALFKMLDCIIYGSGSVQNTCYLEKYGESWERKMSQNVIEMIIHFSKNGILCSHLFLRRNVLC